MSSQTADRLKFIWPPVLIAVLFLSAWQLLVVVRDIQPYLLPAPSLIAENFFGDIALMRETALYTGTTAFLGLVFGQSSAWSWRCSPSASSWLTIWSLPLLLAWRQCPSLL